MPADLAPQALRRGAGIQIKKSLNIFVIKKPWILAFAGITTVIPMVT